MTEDLSNSVQGRGTYPAEPINLDHIGGRFLVPTNQWPVHKHYTVCDDLIVGYDELHKVYFPMRTPEIAQEFQRLGRANFISDEAQIGAITRFVKSWGNLGSEYFGSKFQLAALPTQDAVTVAPLSWIKLHIETVALVLSILKVVRNRSEEDAKRLYYSLPDLLRLAGRGNEYEMGRPSFDPSENLVMINNTHLDTKLSRHMNPSRNDPIYHIILSLATTILRVNLDGIHITPMADPKSGKVTSTMGFTALIEVIWWHTFQLASESIIKVCPECNSLFPATRANQIYCPPPKGASSSASLCAARHRMRKLRDKKDGQEAALWKAACEEEEKSLGN